MYEERFGFTSNPFRAAAQGPAVFVGPQQAKVMSSLQKALDGSDNVVTVSGPVGVGKTTIVTRALETNSKHQLVAWISRLRLAPDEVLELLLAGFGVSRQPAGTVQRFATFKRILNERAKANIRVVIVIEDALRIGNDALLELEALTSSEAGVVGGANIILMGPPEIDKRIKFPELARLRQRTRMGQKIQPFSAVEVQGYLKHCMRSADASFDALFDNGAAAMVYRCSEGIPRVIDSICDAVFSAAADSNASKITRDLVQTVAADMYGLEPTLPEPDPMPVASVPVSEAVPDIAQPASEPVPEPEVPDAIFDPAQVEATVTVRAIDDTNVDLPPLVAAALAQEKEEASSAAIQMDEEVSTANHPVADDEFDDVGVEQLVSDTGVHIRPKFDPDPELELPSSELTEREPEAEPEFESEAAIDEAFDDLPTLSTSMRVDVPEKAASEEPSAVEVAVSGPQDSTSAERHRPIPDLDALEAAISAARNYEPLAEPKITEAIAKPDDLPVAQSPDAEPEQVITIDQSLNDQRQDLTQLDGMAEKLASANSLEDISDVMAETLFGIEFEQIAAEAIANPPATGTMPGEDDVVVAAGTADELPANDPVSDSSPARTVSTPETKPRQQTEPEPIEDQFQSAGTQTLKALKPPDPAMVDDDDDDAGKPGGLLGRIKNTFKG